MTSLYRLAVILFLVLSCGACTGASEERQPKADPAPKEAPLSIGERHQKANLEVTLLLAEADRRQIDVREFRSRQTGITLGSVKNFETATYEMEKLAADLRKALGK